MRSPLLRLLLFALLLSLGRLMASDPTPAPVRVLLWFDTEDFILPADDDATKRLCDLLTERGIRATFKVVGEKARVLERRGRTDVIAALKRHDIGYHTDFHSVHPTPTEYLADCGWLDGIAEFVRREGAGAADVRRIFGVPTLSCYGQPGSSWGPQAVAALRDIGVATHGVPCYVDEDSHIGMDGIPFWYAGALNVFRMRPNLTRMELHDPEALNPAKAEFSQIATRLQQSGGGLVSIFYHPCEWVHREFWDGVNFARGANPPRDRWQLPPQRTAAETDSAFARFAEYVDYIRAVPGVRWVAASDLPALYPDAVRLKGATEADLDELAKRTLAGAGGALDYQAVGGKVFSLAEQFELFSLALTRTLAGQPPRFPIKPAGLLGPDAPPPLASFDELEPGPFREALGGVRRFVEAENRVPARVFVGADTIPPADFLTAMAAAWRTLRKDHASRLDSALKVGRGTSILPERHLAPDTPRLFGEWVIHRQGFRAPKLVELARLQAWTLKPATPAKPAP